MTNACASTAGPFPGKAGAHGLSAAHADAACRADLSQGMVSSGAFAVCCAGKGRSDPRPSPCTAFSPRRWPDAPSAEYFVTSSQRADLASALFATICVIATLYSPQPLLPVLAQQYDLSKATASLAITMTLLPLALAPVAYGLLLESIPASRLARWALVGLAAGHVGVCLAPSWGWILAARLFQGLVAPAALTSMMTLVAGRCEPSRLRRVMSWYIATTIMGGFSGRFFSGLLAGLFHWRVPFAVLAVLLLTAFVLLRRLDTGSASAGFTRPDLGHVRAALTRREFLWAYCMVFCCFFSFTALLNYLPFRLVDLEGGVSPVQAGSMYLGFLVGVSTSICAPRIISTLGGENRAFITGLCVLLVSAAAFFSPNPWHLFLALFPFCAGFFLVQTVGPTFVNARAKEHRGIVNGLYISFYYAGGALGSFVPGLVYNALGWEVFIGLLMAMLVLAGFFAFNLCKKS